MPGDPGGQRLIQRILLIAETAADIRLDNAYFPPRHAQRLPHRPPDDVRYLRRGHHHSPVAFAVCICNEVLNMAMLDDRRFIPFVHTDEPRLLDGFVIVADIDGRMLEYVVRVFLVYQRYAVLHRLLRIKNKRQFVIFHPDSAGSLRGSHLVLRHNRGDVVAIIAHMTVEQPAVRYILMPGIGRPGVPRSGKLDIRHIKAREYSHDAGYLFRFGNINRFHIPMSDRGANHHNN